MTTKEAVAVLLEGYGDDCPTGGDEWLEAQLTLADAGLMDEREIWNTSSDWPHYMKFVARNPDTGDLVLVEKRGKEATIGDLGRLLSEVYVPSIVASLNKPVPVFWSAHSIDVDE